MNKRYGELSVRKKLGKPSLITTGAVNCGGSKGCYIISMDAMSNIIQPLLKGMERNAPPSPSLTLFFTAILTRTKQLFDCRLNNVKLQKKIYNSTYFFQILRSSIRFPKIRKSTYTVNLYSEFSFKSRFATVDFATRHSFWKPNLTFCFWDRPNVFFGK